MVVLLSAYAQAAHTYWKGLQLGGASDFARILAATQTDLRPK